MEKEFRAWDKKEKEMIYEALVIKDIGLGEGSVLVDERTQKGNELIWMQWTGLEDRNEKRCYEGDIIESEDPDGESGVYKWEIIEDKGCFCGESKECESIVPLSKLITFGKAKVVGDKFDK